MSDSLSFEAALARFVEHSPQLAAARARAERRAAEARLALVLPNPALMAEDATATSEQSLVLEQDVPNPWARKARSRAAEWAGRAIAAAYLEEAADLYLELRQRYLNAGLSQLRAAELDPITARVTEAVEVAEGRLEEGDLGAYDVERMRLEADEYADRLEEARVEHRAAQASLSALIGDEGASGPLPGADPSDDDLPNYDLPRYDLPSFDDAAVLERALAERPAVVAARARLEAARDVLEAERRSRWNGFSVTAGVGRAVEPERTSIGPTVGLGLDLPLWNRNGVAIQVALSDVAEAEAELAEARRSTREEVEAALLRLRSYATRLERLGPDPGAASDSVLADALFLYDAGEIGLVELIDAAGAARDRRELRLELLRGVLDSRQALDRAVGTLPASLYNGMNTP